MRIVDGRKLAAHEQQKLREKAVRCVREGTPQTEVAQELGVSRSTVAKWMCAFRAGGERALAARIRGRPPGTGVLTDAERKSIYATVRSYLPKQLGLVGELWTNQNIRHLLLRELEVSVTAMTVSLWMRRWGFVGPQPVVEAEDQYDEDTSQLVLWHLQEYPKVKRVARRSKARIFLFDERPLPDEPCLPAAHSVMLCAIDGPGTLYFHIVTHPVTTEKRIEFLHRLRLDIRRPLLVLLDSHPGNPRPSTRTWRQQDIEDIRLVPIPVRDLQCIPRECWPFEKARRADAQP